MNLNLVVPDELYRQISDLADRQRVSVQRMALAALTEQLAGWNRVQEMASRGDRASYLAALDELPAADPAPVDRF